MNQHPLDLATALDNPGVDIRTARTCDDYWGFVGPFGGIVAALLLRSVMEHPKRLGHPLSLTVNFCAPLAKGAFVVQTRPERTNRSTQHWLLLLTQNGETVVSATVVTAERRGSWTHAALCPPDLPPARDLPPYVAAPGGPAWIGRYEMRFASDPPELGRDPGGPPSSSLSHLWLRDAPGRPLDHGSLASIADAFFGRVFHARREIVPFGTVSMTTHFLGSPDEIAAHGDAFLLGTADAKRYHRSYCDQTVDLWSADGRLLATSTQVCYFKA